MPLITTPRTIIDVLTVDDAQALQHYYVSNQEHLAPWEPMRGDDYFSLTNMQQLIAQGIEGFAQKSNFRFVAFTPDRNTIIGCANFTGVMRGVFQACFLGYSIDKQFEGQGYMTEILDGTIQYMFEHEKLHRIMANYMPKNKASARVLEKCQFEEEGYARHYLKIAGCWEDHVMTARLNPNFE
ncbi:GNAT family N-acetyltransferase [Vibrio sp. CAIM 722]|uniref:GNAT family N-acetyltransferase n=1 Tax=Vibrio eleionomae TaxID=2653505 RepID=A0A7X4LQE6_9VIBR|nr:GNAT family N-acetyltransferase [Vibrio eleionomae]MZI96131.1 GNAT family N-acetyltransferase [Vibrio eleionomae]